MMKWGLLIGILCACGTRKLITESWVPRTGTVFMVLKEEDYITAARFESSCLGVLVQFGDQTRLLTAGHCFQDYQGFNQSFLWQDEHKKNYVLRQSLWAVFEEGDGGRIRHMCGLDDSVWDRFRDLRWYNVSHCGIPSDWSAVPISEPYQSGGEGYTVRRWQTFQNLEYEFAFYKIQQDIDNIFRVFVLPSKIPDPGNSGGGFYTIRDGQIYLKGILNGLKRPHYLTYIKIQSQNDLDFFYLK